MLALVVARQGLRRAVLQALLCDDYGDVTDRIAAWSEVDKAAIAVAAASRKHKKHCREVARNAAVLQDR